MCIARAAGLGTTLGHRDSWSSSVISDTRSHSSRLSSKRKERLRRSWMMKVRKPRQVSFDLTSSCQRPKHRSPSHIPHVNVFSWQYSPLDKLEIDQNVTTNPTSTDQEDLGGESVSHVVINDISKLTDSIQRRDRRPHPINMSRTRSRNVLSLHGKRHLPRLQRLARHQT